MKSTLTPRQQELLTFLKRRKRNPPTYEEIAKELGFSSRGNVADMIARLADRGHIERPAGKARCYVFL